MPTHAFQHQALRAHNACLRHLVAMAPLAALLQAPGSLPAASPFAFLAVVFARPQLLRGHGLVFPDWRTGASSCAPSLGYAFAAASRYTLRNEAAHAGCLKGSPPRQERQTRIEVHLLQHQVKAGARFRKLCRPLSDCCTTVANLKGGACAGIQIFNMQIPHLCRPAPIDSTMWA